MKIVTNFAIYFNNKKNRYKVILIAEFFKLIELIVVIVLFQRRFHR